MSQPARSGTALFGSATNRLDVRLAWRGPSLLVIQPDGFAGAHPLSGWYFRQTRHLKSLRLLVHGRPPHVCSIADAGPHMLELSYVHPEVTRGGGGGSGSGGGRDPEGLLERTLDLRLQYVVHPASLQVSLSVCNRWDEPRPLEVTWLLSADFVGIDDADFGSEPETRVEPSANEGALDLRYVHPELRLRTEVRARGADAWDARPDSLTTRIEVPRQSAREIGLDVRAFDEDDSIDAAGEREREEKLEAWTARLSTLHAPGETPLVGIANVASQDLGSLALLEGPPAEWLTPGAGVPLYQALWGRDALTAAWQAGVMDRGALLEDVLSCLHRFQGTRVDARRDEEPGRIVQQVRRSPRWRLGDTPFDRYYGDVASPFMFIIGLGYHWILTGDTDHARRRWPAALAVLEWAERYGDHDGDGYVEYLTRSPQGPRHQAWKDSDNAVVDEDGRQVEPPIAASEIQGYWHVSLQYMAVLAAALGERDRAAELWRKAAALKERFNRDFWMEDEGFVAFGLDADKNPIRALTSNAGQCLPTGIVSAEHVPRLARRLFEPDLFSGWGIRTLSSGNPAYHPLDYHLGSVWPVENATIVFGLRRYGLDEQSLQLTRALYDLACMWPGGRTPECVGGYDRHGVGHPGCYPRANRVQAWNQSAWPLLVQSLLGLVPCAPLRLLLVDPVLPAWLPELTLKELRVGDGRVSLRFRRDDRGRSHYEVLERHGKLRVVRQPWLESQGTGTWDRLHALGESAEVALTGRM